MTVPRQMLLCRQSTFGFSVKNLNNLLQKRSREADIRTSSIQVTVYTRTIIARSLLREGADEGIHLRLSVIEVGSNP